MRVGLFLMTTKGLRVLEELIRQLGPQWIHYVVAARDSHLVDDSFEGIRERCLEQKIQFAERHEPLELTAPYHFAVSWRWLIAGASNLIILHDSLLPKYRGFAPLPTALIKGEREIGVTALYAGDEYDTGDVVGQKAVEISYPIKIQQAIEKITGLYSDLIVNICQRLKGKAPLVAQPQDETQATYSLWRDEADYNIDWSASSLYIQRFIDSLGHPYKGAASCLNGRIVRIYDSEVAPDVRIENRQVGKVIFMRAGCPIIVCGEGLIRLTDVRDDATGASLLPLKQFRSRFCESR